jgi:hypothetical protein
MVALE